MIEKDKDILSVKQTKKLLFDIFKENTKKTAKKFKKINFLKCAEDSDEFKKEIENDIKLSLED